MPANLLHSERIKTKNHVSYRYLSTKLQVVFKFFYQSFLFNILLEINEFSAEGWESLFIGLCYSFFENMTIY